MNEDVMKMEARKPGLANTPIIEEKEALPEASDCQVCFWNGQAYSENARVCSDDGKLLECRNINGRMRWVVRGRC